MPLDKRGDGVLEDCYFKFNLEPLRDPTRETVFGMMAVAVDITEQVKARQASRNGSHRRARKAAGARQRRRHTAKDEFLADAGS